MGMRNGNGEGGRRKEEGKEREGVSPQSIPGRGKWRPHGSLPITHIKISGGDTSLDLLKFLSLRVNRKSLERVARKSQRHLTFWGLNSGFGCFISRGFMTPIHDRYS